MPDPIVCTRDLACAFGRIGGRVASVLGVTEMRTGLRSLGFLALYPKGCTSFAPAFPRFNLVNVWAACRMRRASWRVPAGNGLVARYIPYAITDIAALHGWGNHAEVVVEDEVDEVDWRRAWAGGILCTGLVYRLRAGTRQG